MGIEIGDILYWNTTGVYGSNISLKSEVLDIGEKYVWIMVRGNLSPTPVFMKNLTKQPLYKITNK